MFNELIIKNYCNLIVKFHDLKQNQRGITSIEYSLIAIAIATLIVAVFYSNDGFLTKLQSKFISLTNPISNTSL